MYIEVDLNERTATVGSSFPTFTVDFDEVMTFIRRLVGEGTTGACLISASEQYRYGTIYYIRVSSSF